MRFMRLALPFMSVACGFAVLPASAAALLPHRAVYDLQLDDASDRSGINGINGRMVYEFNGSACDGYTVTFRFMTQIDTDEMSRMTDQQTTTFEEGDGSSFTFVTRSFIDQKMDKELKGTARLADGETDVSLEKPEKQELTLEATQFPTQHMIELLKKAVLGETFYETTLFDGSEDADKVMTTTVVIGKKAPAPANDRELKAMGTLKQATFWPVDVAYFDLDEGDEVPTYRISFKLHESGVTRDLVMDYGDFSMTGTLVDLSMFEASTTCSQ
jgi:hypothetical protein